jgi:hypothetical protein
LKNRYLPDSPPVIPHPTKPGTIKQAEEEPADPIEEISIPSH